VWRPVLALTAVAADPAIAHSLGQFDEYLAHNELGLALDDLSAIGKCAGQRERVIQYLGRANLTHGRVGEWPAWHVHPYVAIWAIESLKAPGWIGWWAQIGKQDAILTSEGSCKHARDCCALGPRMRRSGPTIGMRPRKERYEEAPGARRIDILLIGIGLRAIYAHYPQ
jgi:hypothetical protein